MPLRLLNHVVCSGAGPLHERGIDVVGIDRSNDAVGVQVARELHIPLVIGEPPASTCSAGTSCWSWRPAGDSPS